MYSEGIGNLYSDRLRPIIFRDNEGMPLEYGTMVKNLALPFSWEACELLHIDFNGILNMYVERPDYIIRGNWVPTMPKYDEDGKLLNVMPFNSFIINQQGPHIFHILGLPLGDDESIISSLQKENVIFKNSFSDKYKKILYYITKD